MRASERLTLAAERYPNREEYLKRYRDAVNEVIEQRMSAVTSASPSTSEFGPGLN